MLTQFNDWTGETDDIRQPKGQHNQSLSTLNNNEEEVGVQYKKTFKGVQNCRDRVPYGLRKATIG